MMTDDDGRSRKRKTGIAGIPSAPDRYGAGMDAAPLDGRDDTGSGDDGHENGGGNEHRRRLPAAAGLIGVLVALIAAL